MKKNIFIAILILVIGGVFYLSKDLKMSVELYDDKSETASNCSEKVDLKKMNPVVFENIKFNKDLLVVSFWATWCKACKEEIPHLIKFCEENNLELMLISNDNNSAIPKVKEVMYSYNIFDGYILSEDNGLFKLNKDRNRIENFMTTIGSHFNEQPGYPYILVLNKEKNIVNEFRGKANEGDYEQFFRENILQD